MKVTTIKEAQDITRMKVEELIGSLQTFEMAINDQPEKKNKGISLLSNTYDDQTEVDLDEEISEVVVLLGKQFNKVLKRLDRGQKPKVKGISSDIGKHNDSQGKTKAEEQHNQCKGPQCFGLKVWSLPV
jgi:hypothetical protein